MTGAASAGGWRALGGVAMLRWRRKAGGVRRGVAEPGRWKAGVIRRGVAEPGHRKAGVIRRGAAESKRWKLGPAWRLAAWLALGCLATVAEAREIHSERSIYRDISVTQDGNRRCLLFNVHRGDRNQTCIDVDAPHRLVFSYTKMSMAGLLLQPRPQRILVAGLGGGSLPLALSELFPAAVIDIVEIDPAVVRVAKEYFFFAETDTMQVTVADARHYIKRRVLEGARYDFIMLDAFTGDYIPEHLLTREFLAEVRAIMAPDGVLVANTFSTSRLYDHESVTYQRTFGEFFNFKLPGSGNRIIIAAAELPSRETLVARARELSEAMVRFAVPIIGYPARMSTAVDWDMSRRELTDQYAPANLLRDSL